MPNVKDIILKSFQKPFPLISQNINVFQALTKMRRLNVGALLIVNGEAVVGIFSERDYARKIALKRKKASETLVKDVMTKNVIFVSLDSTLNDCMLIMIAKGFHHLPVISIGDGSLEGFISMADIVSCIVQDKDFHISQLTQYITGSIVPQDRLWHNA